MSIQDASATVILTSCAFDPKLLHSIVYGFKDAKRRNTAELSELEGQ